MEETTEYIYARIKNVFQNEDEELKIFLFAGLTRKKRLNRSDAIRNKINVEAVVSELIEMSVADAPSIYINVPNHDFRKVIDEEEFKRLKELSQIDVEAFYTYCLNEI